MISIVGINLLVQNYNRSNKRLKTQKRRERKETTTYKSDYDVDITLIATPDHAKTRLGRNGRELIGEHPFHHALKREDRGKSTTSA